MRLKKVIKLFEEGNVSVCGLKGRGKDLLMSNVVVRRKLPYICNIDYGVEHYDLDFSQLDIGLNSYKDFINGTVKYYSYPYPDKTDVYISDAGVYFPSQYCNELNRDYKNLPQFMALSRHIGDCSVHYNSQNLNRVWDKIREQSDTYILARHCFYVAGFVLQRITIYDKYDSALQRLKPLKIPLPLFANREMKLQAKITKANHEAAHGTIRSAWLFYRNKSTYDTRRFRAILEGGKRSEEEVAF